MARYVDRDIVLQIIDSYAKTVTEDGKVVAKAIRDIVEIICPEADVTGVKWISVKDRLPEKEGKYLVYKESECFKSTGTAWFSLDLHEFDEYDFPNKHRPGWNNYDSESGYYEECGVSHWMLLPEPPEN